MAFPLDVLVVLIVLDAIDRLSGDQFAHVVRCIER
jgi:hypothetical protein